MNRQIGSYRNVAAIKEDAVRLKWRGDISMVVLIKMLESNIFFFNHGTKKTERKDTEEAIRPNNCRQPTEGSGRQLSLDTFFGRRMGLVRRWGWRGRGFRQWLKHHQPCPHLLMRSWTPLIKVIQHLTGHCTNLMGWVRPSYLIYSHPIAVTAHTHTERERAPASKDCELSMVAVFKASCPDLNI